jgi:hypothetical protein
MTVAQLIELLQQQPAHHFVVVGQRSLIDADEGWMDDLATAVEEVRPLGQGVVLLEAE